MYQPNQLVQHPIPALTRSWALSKEVVEEKRVEYSRETKESYSYPPYVPLWSNPAHHSTDRWHNVWNLHGQRVLTYSSSDSGTPNTNTSLSIISSSPHEVTR